MAAIGFRPDLFMPAAMAMRWLSQMPVSRYCWGNFLANLLRPVPSGMAAADWDAIRPNLKTVAEAAGWWEILHGHVEAPPLEDDRAFLAEAAAAAESLDWSADPWRQLTAALRARTGRSGKPLFLPLRRALTGRDSGPEMAALLPLIGREETISRLRATA